MSYLDNISNEIITTLIDDICTYNYATYPVIYNQFCIKCQQLLSELEPIYTSYELKLIKERIREYNFMDFIKNINVEEEDLYID